MYTNCKGFDVLQSWFLAEGVGVDGSELVCSEVGTN